MSVPGIVEEHIGDESIAARESLKGDDEVFVTPTRTLVYRAEGLLSDESVEEFPHDATRITVSTGRRKAKVGLGYGRDDERRFKLPGGRVDDVLRPVVAGVLRANDVTDGDERIAGAFRFSELTLVITGERLIKHVGEAVWDGDFDAYHFGDVTGLDYEEGSVATQVVLRVDGGVQRIKVPNEQFPEVRECLESAVLAYHNVSSVDEIGGEDDEESEPEDGDDALSFDAGIDPLDTGRDGESDPTATGGDPTATGGDPTTTESEAPATESEAPATEGDPTAETGDASAGEGDDGSADAGTDPTDGEPDDPGEATAETAAEDSTEEDHQVGAGGGHTGDGAAGGDEATDDDSAAPATPFTEEFESAGDDVDSRVREELEALRESVERQNELLAKQHRAVKQLIDVIKEGEER